MTYRKSYSDMYIPRNLLKSAAWWELTATAIRVYLIFLTKRVVKPFEGSKSKRAGKDKYYIANNGEIQFTYREARQVYGISANAFKRAIDQLIRLGFIDVTRAASGLHKEVSLYAISSRWMDYGTEQFIPAERPKRQGQYGRPFAKRKTKQGGKIVKMKIG